MTDDTFDLSEQLEAVEKGPEFYAQYSSECHECGNDIEEGDLARHDAFGSVVHSECA